MEMIHDNAQVFHQRVHSKRSSCSSIPASPARNSPRQLGVRRNQLYKWQSELRGKADRAFPGRDQHPESADEVTPLKKELERVTDERDILKKATAFFCRAWDIA